ncbi:head-to-tail stopper [Rhodococcus phage MacGully]|nr:head-to-tail stopper [Rhodococcus phage MacGully]
MINSMWFLTSAPLDENGEAVYPKVFRIPDARGDSWGEKTGSKKHEFSHELVGAGQAPRTTGTKDGDGFRGRVTSGYTLYLDDEQVASLRPDDEIELTFSSGIRARYTLDGFIGGADWTHPLTGWTPGHEVNLKFLRQVV